MQPKERVGSSIVRDGASASVRNPCTRTPEGWSNHIKTQLASGGFACGSQSWTIPFVNGPAWREQVPDNSPVRMIHPDLERELGRLLLDCSRYGRRASGS